MINKECPYCGSSRIVIRDELVGRCSGGMIARVWRLVCHECGTCGPPGFSTEGAVAAWETRYLPAKGGRE